MQLRHAIRLFLATVAAALVLAFPAQALAEDLTGTAKISGNTAGQTLKCTVSGSNASSFEYNWVYNGTQLGWGSDNTFSAPSDGAGMLVWCEVRAQGFDGVLSDSVKLVAPPEVTKYTLKVVINGSGEVRYGGSAVTSGQTFQVAEGTATHFTLSSGSGYQCSNVTFTGGTGSWTTGSVNFTMPGGNLTVTITFSERLQGTVTITGSYTVGSTVTCVVSGANAGGLSYQWYSNGNAISGATGTSYTLRDADSGKSVAVSVESSEKSGSIGAAIDVAVDSTPKYTVTYAFVDDPTYGHPSDVSVPAKTTGVRSGSSATLASLPNTTQAAANGTNGSWTRTGWYTTSACTGSAVSSLTVTSDVTVYCKWVFSANDTYTITFNVKDDPTYGHPSDVSIPAPLTNINYGYKVTVPTMTTSSTSANGKQGTWEFVGWYQTAGFGGNQITNQYQVTSSKTLYGKWVFTPSEADPKEVTFSYQFVADPTYGCPSDASLPASHLVTVNKDILLRSLPTTSETTAGGKTGTWKVTGWYLDSTCTSSTRTSFTAGTSDRTFYCKWTFTPAAAKEFTISYVFVKDSEYGLPSGISVPDATVVKEGDPWTAPALPNASSVTKAGAATGTWKVTGWYKDSSCTGSKVSSYTPTADRKFYCKWTFTPETHTVTYVVNADPTYGQPSDAKVPATRTIDCGSDVNLAAGLTTAVTTADGKTGVWTFSGWYTNPKCSGTPVMKLEDVIVNTTVYGKWTFVEDAVPCQVSFGANGGTGTMETVTVVKGESYVLPSCEFIAPEGQQFKAWLVDGAEQEAGAQITVEGDVTLTAVWEDVPEPEPGPDPEPSPEPTPGKQSGFPWWILAIIGGVALIGLGIFLVVPKKKSKGQHSAE